MRLFEFEDDDSLRVQLAGIVSQLRSRAKDTNFDKPYSLTALKNKLGDANINLDDEELRDMLEEPPLKNLISNIKGDKVFFKGMGNDPAQDQGPDEMEKTLDKMSKKATKQDRLE